MTTTLLLDGDIILHHACAQVVGGFDFDIEGDAEHIDTENAERAVDSFVRRMKNTLGGDHVRTAFSVPASEGWRRKLVPSYKMNRTGEKPLGYHKLYAYVHETYGGKSLPTLEADDILGIWSTGASIKGKKIIVSDDKDFFSIPGLFYRPCDHKSGVHEITREEADRFHLLQTLMGDPVDGYKGLWRVGPVKANAILDEDCNWDAVVRAYEAQGKTEEDALETARLARILRIGEYTKNKGVHLFKPTKRFTLYGTRKYDT